MKIYTRIVMDSSTGKIEDADFYEYTGPIAELKDSPSPPAQPDYRGAAQETAVGNLENQRLNIKGNRVNQYTPYGNLIYTQDPNDQDKWSSRIDLSPTGQQLLDYYNQSALGLGKQTGQALDRVEQGLSQPFDYGSVGDVSDAAYKAETDRLDPEWAAREGSMDQKLANQGIPVGSEAYRNAMREFNAGRTDAYGQARKNAIATMPQTYQLAQSLRSQPLNELNALRTGSQVQNPTFNNAPQGQATPGADYLKAAQLGYGAANDAYNSQVGQNNALMSGLFSLGSAAIPTIFSDARLKTNIVRIGDHPLGIGVYEYDIFGRREVGVMAQEVLQVKPEAVLRLSTGTLMVDYGRL